MSDFLTLLPPEIRNAIYEYALLRSEVYPYEYSSSVHAGTIIGEESGKCLHRRGMIRKSPQTTGRQRVPPVQ